MLVMEVPHDLVAHSSSMISTLKEEPTKLTGEGDTPVETNMVNLESSTSVNCSTMNHDDDKHMKSICIDISFKSPSHTGLQTTELVSFEGNVLVFYLAMSNVPTLCFLISIK